MLAKKNFENTVLIYVLIMASISNYIEHLSIWRIIQVILFLFLFFVYKSYKKIREISKHIIILLSVSFILYIFSIIISEEYSYILNNFAKIQAPILSGLIIVECVGNNRNNYIKLMKSLWWIINIGWIINLVIIIIQLSGNPLFIKSTWLSQNKTYADLCCGLFGYNRTHEVCFFSCFIVIYNLSESKDLIGIKKYISTIYIYISIVTMGFISIRNDNIAYFVVLPIFLLIYVYVNNLFDKKKSIDRIKKSITVLIEIAIIVFICSRIQPLVETFNDIVLHRIQRVVMVNRAIGGISGSNERLAQVLFVLGERSSWVFGVGIGNESINEHPAHGFMHFGMNSASSHIWLLGLWSFLLIIIFFSICVISSMPWETRNKKRKILLLIFTIFLTFSIYSNILISQSSMVWIILCFISMKLEKPIQMQRLKKGGF